MHLKNSNMLKRLFDFTFSFFGIILLLPLFLAISSFIKFFDPKGPIFFRQIRIGTNGQKFKLNKFRTMEVRAGAENGSFDAGNKTIITPIGSILRKYKLDELPQLFNVLLGDMSIVGPRPEVKKWTEVYPDKWKIVLTVKPGITDNASILFRNEEEILIKSSNPEETYKKEILPVKLDYYIDYINNQSFCSDIKIIFKTLKHIILK